MPDFELTSVDHDPFAAAPTPEQAASMTHAAPVQAQPYMHPNVPVAARTIADFAQGGLQGAGAPMPEWMAHNPVQEALQNPDNEAAMGMAIPLGGKPTGLSDILPRGQTSAIADRQIHPDVLAAMRSEQTAAPPPTLGWRDIHPDVLAAMRTEQEQPSSLPQSIANGALQQAGGDQERAMEILRGKAVRTENGPMKKLYDQASGIVAYHGSPHDFDKFDFSYRHGEGSRAYGEGGYFAENEEVAQSYKTAGAGKKLSDEEFVAHSALQQARQDPQRALEILKGNSERAGEGSSMERVYDAAADLVRSGWSRAGKMYQVSIKANPEHFLDWDKPLSEQPPEVQQKLNEAGVTVRPDSPTAKNYSIDAALADLASGDARRAFINKQRKRLEAGEISSTEYNQSIPALNRGQEFVANQLRAAGIPGIKYLDQQSRTSGEGTRNFVVFDDKLVDILKKYGLAGLVAAGAYTHQDGNQ